MALITDTIEEKYKPKVKKEIAMAYNPKVVNPEAVKVNNPFFFLNP